MSVIDPLKVHTMGVKKPLNDKQGQMQNLAEQGNRYYPSDGKGNPDEWGAVIKRQAEAFNREQQEKQAMRVNQARQYGEELDQAIRLKH